MSADKSHINLKFKELDNGRKSIYLDYYKGGRRIREALHLYLLPETSKKNISENKRTLKQAEAIRASKQEEWLSASLGVDVRKPSTVCIGEAIDNLEKGTLDKGDKGTANNIRCMKQAVRAYRGLETKVVDIDENYCNGFVDFLHKEYEGQFGILRMTTARNYIYLFSSALNAAVADGIIGVNPLRFVNIHGRITNERPAKKFLSVDDIRALMDTQCPVLSRPQVKQAYLLSLFTGLSREDLLTLKWSDIKTRDGRITIEKRSRKTSIPISDIGKRWLPDTGSRRGLVFKGLPRKTEISNILKQWGKKAGLDTALNFTLAHNTFAYLILYVGTDIPTACSLIGVNAKTIKTYLKMMSPESFLRKGDSEPASDQQF